MVSFTTLAFTLFAGIIAAIAGYIYFIGIPADWKQAAEEKVAEHMAESETKNLVKDKLGKLPEADQQQAEKLKKGLGSLGVSDKFKNPLD